MIELLVLVVVVAAVGSAILLLCTNRVGDKGEGADDE
jgi:hypothetical protein